MSEIASEVVSQSDFNKMPSAEGIRLNQEGNKEREQRIQTLVLGLAEERAVTNSENELRPLDRLADFFGENGVEHEIVPSGDKKSLIARVIIGNGDGPTVLFNTHVDVVPGGVYPTMTEDELFGRGVCDAEGQVGAIALAIAQIAKTKAAGGINGWVIGWFVPDEETGGKHGTEALVRTQPPCDYVVVGEPTENGDGEIEVVTAHSGNVNLGVEFTNKTGQNPLKSLLASGPSLLAVREGMVRDNLWPDQPTWEPTVAGETAGPGIEASNEQVDFTIEFEGISSHAARPVPGGNPFRAILDLGPRLVERWEPISISGGEAQNTIPGFAKIHLRGRVREGESREDILAQARGIIAGRDAKLLELSDPASLAMGAPESVSLRFNGRIQGGDRPQNIIDRLEDAVAGRNAEVKEGFCCPPRGSNPDSPLVQAALRATGRPKAVASTWGSDAGAFWAGGVKDLIVWGAGNVDYTHTDGERVSKESLRRVARLHEAIAWDCLRIPRPKS